MSTPAELHLDQIKTHADIEQLVQGFVPTERFNRVSFDNYRPDPRYPSQLQAAERARKFVADIGSNSNGSFISRWLRRPSAAGRPGLYLDGGFGVGKTHLLAAAYHAAPGPKIYLSFAELSYWLGAMGLEACTQALSRYLLICIDEFELDDVANTRAAAQFLDKLLSGRDSTPRIITTSNTLPSQLGQGRFEADFFKQEIGRIAAAFEVISIDGEDYRQRANVISQVSPWTSEELHELWGNYSPEDKAKSMISFDQLNKVLWRHHPIRYGQLISPLESLFIDDLAPLPNQADALRFVHFIDKVYDQNIRLFVSSRYPLTDLFPATYRNGGYRKKYERCLSRLGEMLSEAREFVAGLSAAGGPV